MSKNKSPMDSDIIQNEITAIKCALDRMGGTVIGRDTILCQENAELRALLRELFDYTNSHRFYCTSDMGKDSRDKILDRVDAAIGKKTEIRKEPK